MNLFCDAEQNYCISLVQKAVFMLKEWMMLLCGWITQMRAILACAPLGMVESDAHQISDPEIRKIILFFNISFFQ